MKSEWIWMPHAGHLCVGDMCRFHFNTYVNGYIVSTVGEYWPDQEVRRLFVIHRCLWPRLRLEGDGKLYNSISDQQKSQLLDLKGDAFDDAYFRMFGFEEIGLNRTYETMVFKAEPNPEHPCCPWKSKFSDELDFEGYNNAKDAYEGHIAMCLRWDNEKNNP